MGANWVGVGSIYLLLGLILGALRSYNGGIGSSYARSNDISADMPLNNNVLQFLLFIMLLNRFKVGIFDEHHIGNVTILVEKFCLVPYLIITSVQSAVNLTFAFNYDTNYFYEVGIGNTRQFWFTTPPEVGPNVPYTFGLIDAYPLHDNNRWDSWARFVERNVAYQPWIWSAGNHEIDFLPEYNHSSLILIGIMCHMKHPEAHLIFGHVHAYERTERVSNIAYNFENGLCTPRNDGFSPVYITIGDGGNQEGLLYEMVDPQPRYSAYREPS
ncbi:hypothetical protein L2E82_06502 [Cichorium intybus]|uniref:Uncharacterized protein n=1 Tax=Cichorium intybus TaxID=13427 RepID=A0ACB9HBB7_CICIN|nr:hypothetical protein L2E82_06502 [Cichorium intybus]